MKFTCLFWALTLYLVASETTISHSSLNIKVSSINEPNILPTFSFLLGDEEGGDNKVRLGGGKGGPKPYQPDVFDCPDVCVEGANEDLRGFQLPYLSQDIWGCEREPTKVKTILMENEYLQVHVIPQWGGKIYKIWDKEKQKDWFFVNPSHQPWDIGVRHAWSSGGLEVNNWSPGIIGHSYYTEDDVYVAKVVSDNKEWLRIYEFDRRNSTMFQVDLYLEGKFFWHYNKMINPTDKDLRGYWWTCPAFKINSDRDRVIAPATNVIQTSAMPQRYSTWPNFSFSIHNSSFKGAFNQYQQDMSWYSNLPFWSDFFLVVPDEVRPFLAHAQKDGFTVVHSPNNSTGAHKFHPTVKVFQWGISNAGRFSQDFLAGVDPFDVHSENVGQYTELQIGLAPTQMQTFPLPSNSFIDFIEWYGAMEGDPARLQDFDYSKSVDYVTEWVNQNKPQQEVDQMQQFFQDHSDVEVDTILHKGKGWGKLQEIMQGFRISKGAKFLLDADLPEYKPWFELLTNKQFSNDTLEVLPTSYQITEQWEQIIRDSIAISQNWLNTLHLGIILAEKGQLKQPKLLFKTSFDLKPNPIAARNLALLNKDLDKALHWYEKVWKIVPKWENDPSYQRLLNVLTKEYIYLLINDGRYEELEQFIPKVQQNQQKIDPYLFAKIRLALYKHQDPDTAIEILKSNCFPTFASTRTQLKQDWYNAHILKEKLRLNRDLTFQEERKIRQQNFSPMNLGCFYPEQDTCPEYKKF